MRDNNDNLVWLADIIQSIDLIAQYIGNLDAEKFFNTDYLEKQDAVAKRLEIIGEAVKNLSDDFKNIHPEIPWHKAAAMRNILIHEYFDIDHDLIWKTLTESLPEFKTAIVKLNQKN